MPQAHPILTNFTAGELSPLLYGRPDLAKYGNAARELLNMIVSPQGGARKRGGFKFVAEVKNSTTNANAILVEFIYSTVQAYILEFGPNYIRFYKDRGQISDTQANITAISKGNPCLVTAAGHGFSNGDRVVIAGAGGMTQINNREFTVANKTTNTFQLSGINSSSYSTYTSGGVVSRIYEVYTVYTADDLADLKFESTGDTLYIAHPDWPLATLVRAGHDDWTHAWAEVEEGPFLDFNTDQTNTISIDVASGAGIMTATKDTFESAHVGSLWRVWEKSNGTSFGYARWSPGSGVNVADDSYWEYDSNVYQIASGGGGTLQSTASYPTHTEGTVDVYYGGGTAQVRYEHSGYVVVRIDSLADAKNANITVMKYRTPYSAYGARSSAQWQEGAWSDKRGYPALLQFHEQRLHAFATPDRPQTVWGSRAGSYLNFRDGEKDDDAYIYTIRGQNVIRHASSGKALALLTTGGEFVMQSSALDQAITPTNIKISTETGYGSAPVRALRIGSVVLFGQRAGDSGNAAQRVREFVYNFQTDSFVAPDLTLLAEHIGLAGLTHCAYQATPDSIAWYRRADGYLCGMTYEREQQVVAWHRHLPGGTAAKVLRVAAIPGATGDELWAIIERTIGGQTRRYIEWLHPGLPDTDDLEDGVFLDASLTYDGSAASTIYGLWHLEGETIEALADGAPISGLVVSGGAVTLPASYSKVHLGYSYTARLQTLRLEAGAAAGTAQGRIKRISGVVVRFHRTVGGEAGRDTDHLDPIKFSDVDDPVGTPIALYSGDKDFDFEGDWDADAFMCFQHDQPLPFHIIALMPSVRTSG